MTVDIVRRGLWRLLAAGGVAAADLGGAGPATAAVGVRSEVDPILATCLEVTLRASMLMDANAADELAAQFTPDMEFVSPGTYPNVSLHGRDALRAFIAGRSPNHVSRHVCTNAIADHVADGQVRVKSYFSHYSGERPVGSTAALPMAGALRSVGEYEDTLRRTDEGWRIARRVGRFIFGGF
jgi:SnoaL-like domain